MFVTFDSTTMTGCIIPVSESDPENMPTSSVAMASSDPFPLSLVLCAGEKMFESVDDLVADGLIVLHMEKHNAMSFIDDARETAKQTTAPTPPTATILGSPQTVPKSDMPFRRLSLTGLSPVLTRRDRPGRLSLRPGRATTSTPHVLPSHEDQRFDTDDRSRSSVDDLAIQPHKRSGSLRLFKGKSFEKRTLVSPSSSPSLVQSCTAADARADPLLSDKRSPLIGRTSNIPRGTSLDERLAQELSPQPQSPKAPVRACVRLV